MVSAIFIKNNIYKMTLSIKEKNVIFFFRKIEKTRSKPWTINSYNLLIR